RCPRQRQPTPTASGVPRRCGACAPGRRVGGGGGWGPSFAKIERNPPWLTARQSYEQKNRPDAGTFDTPIQRAIFGQKVCPFRVFEDRERLHGQPAALTKAFLASVISGIARAAKPRQKLKQDGARASAPRPAGRPVMTQTMTLKLQSPLVTELNFDTQPVRPLLKCLFTSRVPPFDAHRP